jgi:peroxiredoxin
MIKTIFFFCCIFWGLLANAQHSFTGVIESYSNKGLTICQQFGDESKVIAQIRTGSNGNFHYLFEDEAVGLYRIFLVNEDSFDIIYNNEDVHVKTRAENPQYNLEVVKSEENTQLYSYLVNNYIYDYKIDVLNQLLEIYPDGKFYNTIQKELIKEKKLKNKNITKVIKTNPESFAGRYIKTLREIPVPVKFNDLQKIEYLKNKYFEFYDFTDKALINSDAYTNLVLNYFKLFKSNDQQVYYQAAKTILDEIFFGEPAIFSHVFEYILTGFESLSLDEAAYNLSVEYGDLCSDDNEQLKLRIKSNTELAIGSHAPDFTVTTVSGEDYTLSEMKTDYTLLVFWATWCTHCEVALPRLAAAKSVFKEARMEIVAVSVDSERSELEAYLQENNLPWKTICQCEGWDGSIAVDYAVFATPLMIIVDKNMRIVAKPYNEEKLYDYLEEIITNK